MQHFPGKLKTKKRTILHDFYKLAKALNLKLQKIDDLSNKKIQRAGWLSKRDNKITAAFFWKQGQKQI